MSEPVFTTANVLTLLRMGMVPFLIILVLQADYTAAFVVFVVAGVTDALDGIMARRQHQLTRLGAILDPLADKLLLATSFIALTWAGGLQVRIPQWLTVLTLSRDVLIVITALAIVIAVGRRVFQPSRFGKLTTALQVGAAGAVLLANALGQHLPGLGVLFVVTGALTVVSGCHYVWLAYTGRNAAAEAGS